MKLPFLAEFTKLKIAKIFSFVLFGRFSVSQKIPVFRENLKRSIKKNLSEGCQLFNVFASFDFFSKSFQCFDSVLRHRVCNSAIFLFVLHIVAILIRTHLAGCQVALLHCS